MDSCEEAEEVTVQQPATRQCQAVMEAVEDAEAVPVVGSEKYLRGFGLDDEHKTDGNTSRK